MRCDGKAASQQSQERNSNNATTPAGRSVRRTAGESLEDAHYRSAPTHIPAHAADLIKAKQEYSDRKLARNSRLKGLIELTIMYESDPLLFPEDQVDLMAQSAPGAGAWPALPATSTTIHDEAFHQDPSKRIVAYKAWAGVRLPATVTHSRYLHTHGKGHTLHKSATHLALSYLLSLMHLWGALHMEAQCSQR